MIPGVPILRLICCLAGVVPLAAGGAEGAWSLRASLGAGYDSNAVRGFDTSAPDLMASLLLDAEGRYRWERLEVAAAYDGGARKFLMLPSEDTLVQAARARASFGLGRRLRPGLEGTVKDRHGANRAYTDLAGRAVVDFLPDAHVDLGVGAGARRFIYWPAFLYSFSAVELGASARYRFDRRHAVSVFADWGSRAYNAGARPRPGQPDPGLQRTDSVLTAGAGYAYRGPFSASVTYSFLEHTSNSFGERLSRHRLSFAGAARLPWEVMLVGQAALQLTRYPDGVYLSPEQSLAEDDENHNSLSLRLSRPLTDRLDLALRYSVYQNVLPQNDRHYLRHVFWAGLTFRR